MRLPFFKKIGLSFSILALSACSGTGKGSVNENSAQLQNQNPSPFKLISVYPSQGKRTSNTALLLKGEGFKQGAKVLVGTSECLNSKVTSSTTLTCDAPIHPKAETVDVSITQEQSTISLSSSFTYESVPTIKKISHLTIPIGVVFDIVIEGTDFQEGAQVQIGNEVFKPSLPVTGTSLTCGIKSDTSTSLLDLAILNPDGGKVTQTNTIQFDHLTPVITDFDPKSATEGQEAKIVITGKHFADSVEVFVGASPCTVLSKSETEINCSFVPKSIGASAITVSHPTTGKSAQSLGLFLVVSDSSSDSDEDDDVPPAFVPKPLIPNPVRFQISSRLDYEKFDQSRFRPLWNIVDHADRVANKHSSKALNDGSTIHHLHSSEVGGTSLSFMKSLIVTTFNVLSQGFIKYNNFHTLDPSVGLNFSHLDQSTRVDQIGTTLQQLKSDIFCLQEVTEDVFLKTKEVLPKFSGTYLQVRASKQGIAIFYNPAHFDVDESKFDSFVSARTFDATKGVLYLKLPTVRSADPIEVQQSTVVVACGHLPSATGHGAQAAKAALISFLSLPDDFPDSNVLYMGDFNLTSAALATSVQGTVAADVLVNPEPKYFSTYSTYDGTPLQLDHILSTGNIRYIELFDSWGNSISNMQPPPNEGISGLLRQSYRWTTLGHTDGSPLNWIPSDHLPITVKILVN